MSFINNIRRIEEQRGKDDALDYIFDTLDDLLLAERFGEVDSLLDVESLAPISVTAILGIVGMAWHAKGELENWERFWNLTRREVRKRRDDWRDLLSGWE